ncbi:hypothetical protein ACSNOD_30640, partial [Streptomyces sp. URMC 123]
REYAKGATDTATGCAAAASSRLAPALTGNKCTQVMRATYAKGEVAVTVGIAVFDTAAQAQRAKEQADGNIEPLPGAGVPAFCRAAACRLTANAVGRYAYFTVAGYTTGRSVPASDTAALQAGRDVADFAFDRIRARGEAQASAAAAAR